MAVQNDLISICIPTRNRPDLLLLAIASCFEQAHRPLEILVGDDSSSDATTLALQSLRCPAGVYLTYTHNSPALGQSANVNALFARATGARLALLHDDDLFCPKGLDDLVEGWKKAENTSCVFGRQVVITPEGRVDPMNTLSLDCMYERNALRPGAQPSALSAGLLQHLPNNCFLVDTDLARRTGYRSEREVGQAVDADFGIRMGMDPDVGSFVFVSRFVSAYRFTAQSIARSADKNQDYHLLFRHLDEVEVPVQDKASKNVALRRIGAASALDAANSGERKMALRIFTSPYFARSYFSIHSAMTVMSIASPGLGRMVRPFLKRAFATGQALSMSLKARREQPMKGGRDTRARANQEDLAVLQSIERHMAKLNWIGAPEEGRR